MSADGTPVGRRVFLGLVGVGAVGVLIGGKISDGLGKILQPVTAHDPTGLADFLPVQTFRYYSITGEFPHKAKAQYQLAVKGLVDKPAVFSYDELLAMSPMTLTRDFQCVTGWRVPKVKWKGVLLSDVLKKVGVKPEARALRFTSFDGAYSESLTLDQARRSDVMVAYEMEGKPITSDHGGPVRLYVAPMYGYKSCKWLSGIELTDHVIPGYWEENGYDVDGWVGRSNGRDDAPTS
jgi:DMSO/TMAO reductase YedYZ molybdopterin-dependent catalytic subunit